MLAILFPHMFEDIEYLIPDEARVNGHNDGAAGSSGEKNAAVSVQLAGPSYPARLRQENAVAGPSRLA
jgi:E3 ubiquitin-protein ligase SHPRH